MEATIGFDLRSLVPDPSWTAEAASLAPVWTPRLNEWHLFGNPEHATAFAAVTDQRVPEHAPFYGYGIYQVR
jgi:hypothetical protein